MNMNARKWIALMLSVLMLLSALAGCTPKQEAQPAEEQVQEEVPEVPAEEAYEEENVEAPAEEDSVEEAPVEETSAEETSAEEVPEEELEERKEPRYQEALALLFYLRAIKAEDRLRSWKNLTGEAVNVMLEPFGKETAFSLEQETVTGAELVPCLAGLLGYDAEREGYEASTDTLASFARKLRLTAGFETFDPEAPLSNEEGAQLIRNAMKCNMVSYNSGAVASTDKQLASMVGLEHRVLADYVEGFNRPGSCWYKEGTEDAVTAIYPDCPVLVSGQRLSWCQLLESLGYAKEDTEHNNMKVFQNSVNGEEYTVKYEKCHWGTDAGLHGGCENDFTSENSMTLEVYQIGDSEYRNIYYTNFLGQIEHGAITLYGYNNEVWGPWPNEGLPSDGFYIVHYYWNAYGAGEGFDICQPAEVVYGTMKACNDYNTIIDDTKYSNAMVFNYGSEIAKASANQNVGKKFSFFLDQYGYVIGCAEGEVTQAGN